MLHGFKIAAKFESCNLIFRWQLKGERVTFSGGGHNRGSSPAARLLDWNNSTRHVQAEGHAAESAIAECARGGVAPGLILLVEQRPDPLAELLPGQRAHLNLVLPLPKLFHDVAVLEPVIEQFMELL